MKWLRPRILLRRFAATVSSATATNPCVARENGVGKSYDGPFSGGSGRGVTVRPRSWRKVCTPTPPRRLSRCLFGALFLALAACAHQPLTRSCITPEQYGQLKNAEPPKVHSKLTGKADEDVRPLAGSAIELRAWGHALLDTLKICSEKP